MFNLYSLRFLLSLLQGAAWRCIHGSCQPPVDNFSDDQDGTTAEEVYLSSSTVAEQSYSTLACLLP